MRGVEGRPAEAGPYTEMKPARSVSLSLPIQNSRTRELDRKRERERQRCVPRRILIIMSRVHQSRQFVMDDG